MPPISSTTYVPYASTHWLLEGQLKQQPSRWDAVSGKSFSDEQSARTAETEYRALMSSGDTGWLDFRVVSVTTIREVLPSSPTAKRVRKSTKKAAWFRRMTSDGLHTLRERLDDAMGSAIATAGCAKHAGEELLSAKLTLMASTLGAMAERAKAMRAKLPK